MATDEIILCVNTECPSRNICKRFANEIPTNRIFSSYKFDDVTGCGDIIVDRPKFEAWFRSRMAKRMNIDTP